MPAYLLSVWHDAPYEVDVTGPDAERIAAQVGALNADLAAMGAIVGGGGLEPPERAVVARADGGTVHLTDGPRTGPYPAMGGFWILELPDDATARDVAARAARACEIAVELRAFHEPI